MVPSFIINRQSQCNRQRYMYHGAAPHPVPAFHGIRARFVTTVTDRACVIRSIWKRQVEAAGGSGSLADRGHGLNSCAHWYHFQ